MIKDMEIKGEFIPICTRRVFMKFYNDDNKSSMQNYFWGISDRKSYTEEMKTMLAIYLKESRIIESEESENG